MDQRGLKHVHSRWCFWSKKVVDCRRTLGWLLVQAELVEEVNVVLLADGESKGWALDTFYLGAALTSCVCLLGFSWVGTGAAHFYQAPGNLPLHLLGLVGDPSPMSQLGNGHFISTFVISMFTWSDQLQICGRLTPGLPSFFTSVRFAQNEMRHEQNHYHFDEF